MTDVVMPQMGESIVEGTLTKWLKKAGDHVERDEPLFEISTDKVDTEIPSPAAGVLAEVLIEEGKTVGINTVVARINDGSAAAPAPVAVPAAPAEIALPLSPLVRKMARENNIDLSRVKGTGAGGRITDWSGQPLRADGDGRVLAVGDPRLLDAAIAKLAT